MHDAPGRRPSQDLHLQGERIMTPVVPENVATARKQVETSDFFALCHLMLSNLAYTDQNSGPNAVQQITDRLPNMPAPQDGVTGKWRLGWGPQFHQPDNSNLMYAAELIDSASGFPVFSAVVIRGTDTQAKPAGVLEQILEDLDSTNQVVFPANNQSGSKIAQGSQDGLNILTSFKDSGNRTVEEYLADFAQITPGAPLVVTGHSLGGCQTTVLALYLADKLSGQLPPETTIVPNTFAAPTAGNAAFIGLYERTFPFCPRWFNTFDLVPTAFAGLGGIKNLWNQCNRPAPDAFKIIVDGFGLLLGALHVSYSQQSQSQSRPLNGACQPAAAPAATSAIKQEVTAEVQTLLQDAAKKLQDRIGQLPLLGGFAAGLPIFNFSQASLANIGAWVQELLFQHSIQTGYWNAVASSPGVGQFASPFVQAVGAGGNP
jgi:hypothetical protein